MNKVSENPLKNRETDNLTLIIVTALFVTSYLVSNIMAVKVIGIFDFFYFDAGTITFPFAYMLGDVLTEIWGYRTARRTIILTLFCNILMVISEPSAVVKPVPAVILVTVPVPPPPLDTALAKRTANKSLLPCIIITLPLL